MGDKYYTIGMAGHIDHGKTALTKALTNVDTDRLKEEKERNISIEAGYAPLQAANGTHVSIVDVPGHERFIRQMIAGVAGIDLVVLVIAADEGVMPQTEEHIEILRFLGIEHCIVAITKIDRADEEILEIVTEDVRERLEKTRFQDAPYVYVDSLSGTGIEKLKETIFAELEKVTFRDSFGSFRLPIDQVFTVQGQGTIVRGTVYEGKAEKGSQLTVLPKGLKAKVRQIQVHHEEQQQARAGQRAAINLGGVNKEQISRGDVLVASDHFLVTDTVDIVLKVVNETFTPLKQRSPVKIHVGTSEVMGKIVFFDRNELAQTNDEVLCQIRLDEEIVVRRGDRFILRRPTPVETLGGGWVIEPKAGKYRFGEETISMLRSKMEGTPEDLVADALSKQPVLSFQQLLQDTSLIEEALQNVIEEGTAAGTILEIPGQGYSAAKTIAKLENEMLQMLSAYHEEFSLRAGMGKAELVQSLSTAYPKPFIEYTLNRLTGKGELKKDRQYVALAVFEPHLPKKWRARMEEMVTALKEDGLAVKKWDEYVAGTPVPKAYISELPVYLLETKQAERLTDDMLIHRQAFQAAVAQLRQNTGESFDLKEAKEALNISRKYLIPFLELLDQQNITIRQEEKRQWTKEGQPS
ncbi:selenocysteine-specific translation elongation factor [Planococcus salinus]|uniref:Selenocysteine-specific elongation factor n=1 Tax=Planococcus salinus TaxID=1848460 RepID=A0A3M8P890_9BACL|nr:selenocysteine-specific translation elongation factor [Planococcus salinus]RNF39858.1 selenocysteine-specific translation elongation factor [Planococcus salinus]